MDTLVSGSTSKPATIEYANLPASDTDRDRHPHAQTNAIRDTETTEQDLSGEEIIHTSEHEDDTHNTDEPRQSPLETPHFPMSGQCHACGEHAEKIFICDDCELPLDYQCILSIRNRITGEDEYQCVTCHRKYNATHASDDLSESSDINTSNESSTVKGSVASATSLDNSIYTNIETTIETLDQTTTAKAARHIPTCNSPPKTRNSTKKTKVPPDPKDDK